MFITLSCATALLSVAFLSGVVCAVLIWFGHADIGDEDTDNEPLTEDQKQDVARWGRRWLFATAAGICASMVILFGYFAIHNEITRMVSTLLASGLALMAIVLTIKSFFGATLDTQPLDTRNATAVLFYGACSVGLGFMSVMWAQAAIRAAILYLV